MRVTSKGCFISGNYLAFCIVIMVFGGEKYGRRDCVATMRNDRIGHCVGYAVQGKEREMTSNLSGRPALGLPFI